MQPKFFLSTTINGEKKEYEVSIEEYCRAERSAGFQPPMSSDNPKYMTTPATAGFSSSNSLISGHIKYGMDDVYDTTPKELSWKDVLYPYVDSWAIDKMWDLALVTHYPYFMWNGDIYDAIACNKTNHTVK